MPSAPMARSWTSWSTSAATWSSSIVFVRSDQPPKAQRKRLLLVLQKSMSASILTFIQLCSFFHAGSTSFMTSSTSAALMLS